MTDSWLRRYTKILVGVTFLLIVAGGLVTSTDSGLSVPDWPLSYNQWMPPMVGGIRFEHTHRMIASLVGLMTFILTLWLGFRERRAWVRWAGIAAFGMVVGQGVLGGITVLYLLPAPVSIFHACLAQTFFALIVGIAFFTSREWSSPNAQGIGRTDELKRLLFFLTALIYAQLILGATVRHTENHYVLISHIASGFLILLHAILVTVRGLKHFEDDTKVLWPALGIGTVTVFQMFLGMGAFIYQVMLPITVMPAVGKIFFLTAHQTAGALLLGLCVFFLLRVFRLERAGAQ